MIMHTDPGHGWLEVSLTAIESLGLIDHISSFSYIKGTKAYLEEDCDLSRFVDVWMKLHGVNPMDNVEGKYLEETPIRNYQRYSPSLAREILRAN
jgi:hypothetical protein